MSNPVPMSKAQAFPKVTTRSRFGGIGEGHLIDGVVYQSAGNGFAYEDLELLEYWEDGGRRYIDAVRRLVPEYFRDES